MSGGGDSVITLWKDKTESVVLENETKMRLKIESEQKLSNYIAQEDWRNAVTYALTLDQPYRLLKFLTELIKQHSTGLGDVEAVISDLDNAQLSRLLKLCADWNTNTRTSAVAQRVTNLVVSSYPPNRLLEIDRAKEIFDALSVYSKRHYDRLERMMETSFVIDYVCNDMNGLFSSADIITQ